MTYPEIIVLKEVLSKIISNKSKFSEVLKNLVIKECEGWSNEKLEEEINDQLEVFKQKSYLETVYSILTKATSHDIIISLRGD